MDRGACGGRSHDALPSRRRAGRASCKPAPIYCRDPQLRHRNYFSPFTESLIGPFEIPRSGFVFKGVAEDPLSLPARFGSDNEQILGELLGYDKVTIEQWRQEEVLT